MALAIAPGVVVAVAVGWMLETRYVVCPSLAVPTTLNPSEALATAVASAGSARVVTLAAAVSARAVGHMVSHTLLEGRKYGTSHSWRRRLRRES